MTSTSLYGKYSNYRYCIVRECKNTSIKTPGKLWIRTPSEINMRNTWLKLANKDPDSLSTETKIYFCEDHFDLENDMENYIQYKIMGSVKRIRMKHHCIPSRFDRPTDRKLKLNCCLDNVVKCGVSSAVRASPATARVKDEPLSDETGEGDEGDAAADDLYAEHEVKHELVLGPERLQPQDITYALRE